MTRLRKSLSIVFGSALALFLTCSIATTSARADLVFDNALVRGTYAGLTLSVDGDFQGAAISLVTCDGMGNLSAVTIANAPANAAGERMFVPMSRTGTYSVNPDGTGSILFDDGREGRFVITRVASLLAPFVAEIRTNGVGLDPATSGLSNTRLTRLPEGVSFSQENLQGRYAVRDLTVGGAQPASLVGSIEIDGNGGAAGTVIFCVPEPGVPCGRQAVTTPVVGTFTLDPNGFGTATSPVFGEAVIVVAAALPRGPVVSVEEFFIITKDLTESAGHLLVMRGSKICD